MKSPLALFSAIAGLLAVCMAQLTFAQGASSATRPDRGECLLRTADLDKLTRHRWEVGRYSADRLFNARVGVRTDTCELMGRDAERRIITSVILHIAKGTHAENFAKYWHSVCAESLLQEARGKVQPVPGVPGGQHCVASNGRATLYWIESPVRTVQIEAANEAVPWAVFPQILAAIARAP